MDVGYRFGSPFFITKCFIHRLRYCVYACNAMPFAVRIYTFVDIKPYTTVHRFDIPYHQKYFVVPLFIWAVINRVYLSQYQAEIINTKSQI